jgi:outer membrane protein assembly factor BamB
MGQLRVELWLRGAFCAAIPLTRADLTPFPELDSQIMRRIRKIMNTQPNGTKKYRFPLIVTIMILAGLLLSSCAGGTAVNGWPGLSVNQETAYLSYQGAVYAVNSASGSMAWRFPKDKPDATKPFFAAPAFGADGSIVVGDYAQILYGLNSSGVEQWQFPATNAHFVGSALVLQDMILAPASDGYLYALSLTGTQKWKFKTSHSLWAQPSSDGELIFEPGYDHFLYALKPADGSLAWKTDLDSPMVSAAVLGSDGTLYVTTMIGEVIALNSKDGSVKWRTQTEGSLWSSPVLGETALYVGNSSGTKTGKVLAISLADGNILWSQDAGSPIIGGGVLIPDMVVFATEGGSVTAWSQKDGIQGWTQSIGGKLYTTPVIAGDHLIVAVTQGDKLLQALSFNGQLAWQFVLPK